MTRRTASALLFFALGVGVTGPGAMLSAQDSPRTVEPVATLAPWAEDVWLALLDRDGSFHGRLSNEGVFQRFNTLMDYEYELDVRSGLHDAEGDVEWFGRDDGVRVRGASVSPTRILNRLEWKHQSRITGSVDLVARYRRDRSLTAHRDYPWVGVAWRDVGASAWTMTAGFGVHSFKPSADLRIGLSRSWTDADGSRWDVDVGVTALDALNNAIFDGIGVEDGETRAHFSYESIPLGFRGSVARTTHRWHMELHAGSSNAAPVQVTFPETSERPFDQAERVRFLGGLAQLDVTGSVSVAAYGTVARAEMERAYPDSPAGDFEVTEQNGRLGLRVRGRLGPDWAAHTNVERLWRPEDRTFAAGAPLDHDDREDYVEVALARRPTSGWTSRLAYHLIDRDAGVRSAWLASTHHRLTTEWGYRFVSGFRIVAGIRWDLDDLGPRPFDGAHLHFVSLR